MIKNFFKYVQILIVAVVVILVVVIVMKVKKIKKKNLVNQGKKRVFYLMSIFLKKPKSLYLFYKRRVVTILFWILQFSRYGLLEILMCVGSWNCFFILNPIIQD
jgi:hypothetical protein